MIPILYPGTETSFTSNGLGPLPDVCSCVVTEARNGEYELEMEYPINGLHFSDLSNSKLIYAKPADGKDPQPFYIYKITKPINGVSTIYARHISYRMSYIPVLGFQTTGVSTTLNALLENSVETNPFTVWTDITDTTSTYSQKVPNSFRSCIGGVDGCVVDTFGGELEWDKFAIKLHQNRGSDNGVRIEYGKNLTDLTQEDSIENTITGIYPYWTDRDNLVMVTCGIVECTNASNFPFKRTIPYDASQWFDEQPSVDELKDAAEEFVSIMNFGTPEVNLTISFVALWQTEEYKNIACLERVNLCDTVSVYFSELGVNATAKVIKTEYDVLYERYQSIELGSVKTNLVDAVESVTRNAVTNKIEYSDLKSALIKQTSLISGSFGGNVVTVYDTEGRPCETIYGDTDNTSTMINCIRINKNGIGFSNNGFNGPYVSAWTINGGFNADFIQGGTIRGNLIENGSVSSDAISGEAKNDIVADTNAEVTSLKESTHTKFSDLGKYLRIADGKIVLGAQNSTVKLRIENDKISHLMGDDSTGSVMSFWTNDSFDISKLKKFRLGNMALVVQPNSSISFVKAVT